MEPAAIRYGAGHSWTGSDHLFSDPGKGLLSRFGLGLWDLYGVTRAFGDVLSYVRLFALGLSSGILGFVVNNIAFSLLDGKICHWHLVL